MYKCNNCDYESSIEFLLCPQCKKGFGYKVEEETKTIFSSEKEKKILKNEKKIKKRKLLSIKDLKSEDKEERLNTGFKELDKVFGGGIMRNSLNLIYGSPGIGKSTLLLELINNISKKENIKCAYISGEETPQQIKKRYKRLKLTGDFIIDDETNLLQ